MHVWEVVGGSVQGTSHIERGLPCQDAHQYRVSADNTLVIAVADGAGSAVRAEEGARLAVLTSMQYLSDRLAGERPDNEDAWATLMRDTLTQARSALEQEAADTSLRQLATTLLLVAVTDEHLATLQVGDGGIVVRESSGALRVLTDPGHGEYVNETNFVTSSRYLEECHCRVYPTHGVEAIAVFTDGVQFLAVRYADNTAHELFFAPLFGYAFQPDADAAELTKFLSSDRVNDLVDDDKTLVIAVLNEAS
jgi:Protein phosphatase 2C